MQARLAVAMSNAARESLEKARVKWPWRVRKRLSLLKGNPNPQSKNEKNSGGNASFR